MQEEQDVQALYLAQTGKLLGAGLPTDIGEEGGSGGCLQE